MSLSSSPSSTRAHSLPSALAPRTPSPAAACAAASTSSSASKELFEEFEWAEMDRRSRAESESEPDADLDLEDWEDRCSCSCIAHSTGSARSDGSRECGCAVMDVDFRGLNLNRSDSPQTVAWRGRQKAPAVTPCRDCYQEPPSRRERERSNPAQKGPSPSNRSMPSTLPQPARSSRTSLAATHPSSGSHHHMQASQPAYASQASIRHWVHAIETGCPTRTFSASSSNIINASANANTRQSAMKMRSPSSGSSKCITSQSTRLSDTSAYPNPVPPPLASYSSLSDVDGARDINTNWFAMPNHASHRNIPPLPSTPSSAQRPAMPAFSSYQIPRKLAFPIDYVDNATWTKQSWRDESSLNAVDDEPMPMDEDTIQDAYPRPSSRQSEIHLTSLATAFARSEFSPLMHQTFTFALTGNDTEGSDSGQPDMNATRFYPAALPLDELDLTSQWSPPALRSASSTSSLDPFSMDLFSPTTEFPDAASVWDDSYRSIDESSISPDDYSSSPFIGWSSASDKGDPKAVLPMLTMGYTTATQPLTTIPLHQPQPIRPIPPIPVDLLDEAIANDDYIADG